MTIKRNALRIVSASLLFGSALTTVPALAQSAPAQTQTVQADIILRGGTIYTGDAAPFVGDVVITGDRITFVGRRAPGQARRVIDARGMVVAPGFIDPHTHIGEQLASDQVDARLLLPFLMQGVTTAFIGVDGGGSPDVAGVLGAAANPLRRVGINYAAYVGLGAVRSQVIGAADRAPTDAELTTMRQLVANAMCSGALGLSTGLFYAPQSFARRDEVVALAREAATRGGTYDSHIRDESSYTIGLPAAIEEALVVGREANLPVHIAHIKALGVDVHGQAGAVIAQIEAAQRAGQIVHADQYPWSASGTGLSAALMPRWAQDGGRDAMLARFNDAATLERIRTEMRENMRRRGGAASLLITNGPPRVMGKTLEQIAAETGADPIDAAIAILREREAGVASFNQSEEDIAAFMRQPWVVTSSDASLGHPRYYGSFARKYAVYVKANHVIDMRTFIERSSAATADMFGLEGRGHLRAGAFADVIAFDPARFAGRSDYTDPFLFATGMRTVIVNGRLAVDDGQPTGTAAGVAIARTPAAGTCP
jgi:N-acyl-D-aspartate/D-glutamate deacylase